MIAQSKKISLGGIIMDILKDILFFPFWWYSFGLFEFLLLLKKFLSNKQKSLGLEVWIKNIFVPMYGQKDWQGILISIFIRIVQIIFRSFALLLWLIFAFVIFCLWLIFPFATIAGIIWQFI